MRCSRWAAWSAIAFCFVAGGEAHAGGRCRGTKVPYAGRCVYPSELAAIRQKAAQRKAAQRAKAARARAAKEKAAREKAAKEKAAREKAAKEKASKEKAQRDEVACANARSASTQKAWESYQQAHPQGRCAREANEAISALATAKAKAAKDKAAKAGAANTAPTQRRGPTQKGGPKPLPSQTKKTVKTGPPPPPPAAPSTQTVSPLVWAGFGTAAAFGIAGGVLGGLSFAESKELQKKCINNLCSPELMDDVASMKLKGHLATVGLAVAGAGAVVGVLGLVLKPKADSPLDKDKTNALNWQLGIGAGNLQLRLSY